MKIIHCKTILMLILILKREEKKTKPTNQFILEERNEDVKEMGRNEKGADTNKNGRQKYMYDRHS